ncbi:MAG: phytoene desaturase family protein [Prosthecochloris sp.]|nr:phytoene desaturase family protein [Prosthecochloris sp.]
MKRVAIAGAGIGGLSAAARLAKRGYLVDVYEKNSVAGGKATERLVTTPAGRFRWDCGPSLLTMPHLLEELFAFCDERLEDHLTLHRIDTSCRYHWTDGTVIDENSSFWNLPPVRHYLDYARGLYELSAPAFLERAPRDWWKAFNADLLTHLKHLPKFMNLQSMAELNRSFFEDPHLCQIFDRFATYNGSSPFRTLSTFAIIPYVEAEFGAWYPEGGIARIPDALVNLARRQGVRFHFNHEVTDLDDLEADVRLCNGDIITAHQKWLPESVAGHDMLNHDLACSGWIMLLGLKKRFPRLEHHNILFSDHYRQEFDDIFSRRRLPAEPTIYIASTSKHPKSTDAPEGCENWFVMVNAPAVTPLEREGYEQVVFDRLRAFGVTIDPDDILHQESFSAEEFATRHNAWKGSLYGWASHSIATALFRPPMQHPHHQDLYFTGGTTHPGGGIPLVLLSGKIASDMIASDVPPL